MEGIATSLRGPVVIERRVSKDEREFFLESWNGCAPAEAGAR
jgi:dTDP-4-dehydrorhamnose 3,5-epimerase-like enzyme